MKDIEIIYRENHVAVLNYINWKINNIEDSEEIANDVFIKVNNNLNNYDANKSAFGTWLRTITNNSIIDYYRKNAKESKVQKVSDFVNADGDETFQFIADRQSEAGYQLENDELSQKLLKAFRSLKPKYRKIALLYFMKDKQYNEIAEICQIPMGTVKGHIFRIREMLQAELKEVHVSKMVMAEMN